ncbi:MAG: serine hydrolase, partial [Sphingobium sp.]
MQIESRIVKRLGWGAGIAALVVAGSFAGRAAQQAPAPLYAVASDAVVGESALRAAIDPLFDEDQMGQTRALLVMRDGKVIAERYAPGFGPDTKLLSWSMAKSVTAVLVGLMVADGRLALDAPVP